MATNLAQAFFKYCPKYLTYISESVLGRLHSLIADGGDYYSNYRNTLESGQADDESDEAKAGGGRYYDDGEPFAGQGQPVMSKRRWYYRRNCNVNRITAQAFVEFLKTGRLCGRRVVNIRFGLTGR